MNDLSASFFDSLIDSLKILKRLYKYRCWDNEYHKALLTRSEIFFPPASKLDDPSETTVPLSFELGANDQLLQLAERVIRENEKGLTEDEIFNKAHERLSRLRNDSRQFQSFHEWEQRKKYSEFGIFSASEIYDSIAMWELYSDHHKGFCVGFRTDKLANFIQKVVRQHRIMPYPVEYYKSTPVLNPFELGTQGTLIKSLTIKSYEWDYQREYRLVLIGTAGKSLNDADRNIVLDDDIFTEVILGANISREHEEEIIAILKGRPSRINLRKAELVRDEQQISIYDITY